MDIYKVKKQLDDVYKDYSKNDLLWVLALFMKKARMRGPISNYFQKMDDALPEIKRKIAEGVPRGFRPLITDHSKDGLMLLYGDIDGIPVMLKKVVLLDDDDNDIAKSVYEALVYKHFFSYLIENKITPNVPYYFGMRHSTTHNAEAISLYGEFFEDGSDMYNYLHVRNDPLPIDFWRPLLFQIIWTLTAFEKLSLVNNDLHLQNIYLLTGLTGKIAYKYENKNFIVNLDKVPLVKIYDMDLASTKCNGDSAFLRDYIRYIDPSEVEECPNKHINNNLQRLGLTTDGRTSQFDLFVSLCTILRGYNNVPLFEKLFDSKTLEFIYKIFDQSEFTKTRQFHCRAKPISDAGNTVAGLLKDDYFKPLIENSVNSNIPTFKLT